MLKGSRKNAVDLPRVYKVGLCCCFLNDIALGVFSYSAFEAGAELAGAEVSPCDESLLPLSTPRPLPLKSPRPLLPLPRPPLPPRPPRLSDDACCWMSAEASLTAVAGGGVLVRDEPRLKCCEPRRLPSPNLEAGRSLESLLSGTVFSAEDAAGAGDGAIVEESFESR